MVGHPNAIPRAMMEVLMRYGAVFVRIDDMWARLYRYRRRSKPEIVSDQEHADHE